MSKPMSHDELLLMKFTVVGLASVPVVLVAGMVCGVRGDRLIRGAVVMLCGVLLPGAFHVDWSVGVVVLLFGVAMFIASIGLSRSIAGAEKEMKA